MTTLQCVRCGGKIGDREADGRVTVIYKGLRVEVERGRVGCGHFIRKGVDADGTQRWAPCGAMTPVVAAAAYVEVGR